MADLQQQKVALMLNAVQRAHHSYQEHELGGKRNEQWAAWYADYLATNGLGELLGKEVDLDDLAVFLEENFKQFETSKSKDAWPDYIAAHLIETFE